MGKENLIPGYHTLTKEENSRGGKRSVEVRRERRTIAEVLRQTLDEPLGNETGLSRQEAIIVRVVKRLYDQGDIRDLKVLADVLGESIQNINVNGVAPIVAKDPADAEALARMLAGVKARQEKKDKDEDK